MLFESLYTKRFFLPKIFLNQIYLVTIKKKKRTTKNQPNYNLNNNVVMLIMLITILSKANILVKMISKILRIYIFTVFF